MFLAAFFEPKKKTPNAPGTWCTQEHQQQVAYQLINVPVASDSEASDTSETSEKWQIPWPEKDPEMAPMEFIKGPLPQPCVATPGSSDMMRPGMTLPPALGMSAWEDGEEAGFGSVGSINQMPWAKLIRDHTSLSSSATAAPSIEVWPASWVQKTFVIRGGVGRLNDGNTFSTQKFVPSLHLVDLLFQFPHLFLVPILLWQMLEKKSW